MTRPPLPRALEALLAEGLVTEAQAEVALGIQAETGRRIEEILVEAGIIAPDDLARATARRLGVPFLRLEDYVVDFAIVRLVPELVARRHRAAPVNRVGNGLVVAMADPLDLPANDEIQLMTGLRVKPVAASAGAIAALLDAAWAARSERPGELLEP